MRLESDYCRVHLTVLSVQNVDLCAREKASPSFFLAPLPPALPGHGIAFFGLRPSRVELQTAFELPLRFTELPRSEKHGTKVCSRIKVVRTGSELHGSMTPFLTADLGKCRLGSTAA